MSTIGMSTIEAVEDLATAVECKSFRQKKNRWHRVKSECTTGFYVASERKQVHTVNVTRNKG